MKLLKQILKLTLMTVTMHGCASMDWGAMRGMDPGYRAPSYDAPQIRRPVTCFTGQYSGITTCY